MAKRAYSVQKAGKVPAAQWKPLETDRNPVVPPRF